MKSALNQQFLDELAVELRDLVLPVESLEIQQEFEHHIEERRLHLLDLGLSEAEAEAAAVAAMGSPSDIAKPYASVSTPGRRCNILAIVLGLCSAYLFYFGKGEPQFSTLQVVLAMVLAAASVCYAAIGAMKGFALTFGRLLHYSGWVTMLGLVGLLIDFIPSEVKVAPIVKVTHEVKGVTLYRAPDSGELLSVSEGPTKDTAFLVFTKQKAGKGVVTLPAHLLSAYNQEAESAHRQLDLAVTLELKGRVQNALTSAFLGGIVCAIFALSAFLVGGQLRKFKPPKRPPTRPSHT